MKHQWMPLFWGDLLANTMHLSAQEFGAYMLLIGHAWEHDATVPYVEARQIARVIPPHWPRVWAVLEPFFEVEKSSNYLPTLLLHRRVLIELSKAREISNKRKGAGMAGAMKRWHGTMAIATKTNGKTHGPAIASYKASKNLSSNGEIQQPTPPVENSALKQLVADKKGPSETTRAELEATFVARQEREQSQQQAAWADLQTRQLKPPKRRVYGEQYTSEPKTE